MATGRLPFNGDSVTETIDRIAHAQPEAIARFNYDVPTELEVIIKKALRKNREERYQTARDLLSDLKSLKHELEFDARPVSTDAHGAAQVGRGRPGAAVDHAPRPAITNNRGTTFSRDGTLIYYVATSKDYPSGALYQMLPIAGPAKRLLADIAGPVALAPDGSRFAFVRTQKGRSDLVTAKVDGTDE